MQFRSRVIARLAALSAAVAVALLPNVARAEFPTLDRAIELARERSLVVADAMGELGVANAQMAGAKVSFLSNPYTEVQVDRPVSPGDGKSIQALTFTYFPLDIAGQRGKRVDEAARLIDWKKLGLVDARSIATGNVVGAYGEIVISAQRVVEAGVGETAARDEAKYFQGRFEAKDTTLYEKSLAEAEIARWVQTRAEAELRLAQARATFSQLTGSIEMSSPPPGISVAPPPLRGPWDDAQVNRILDKSPVISRLNAERHYWDASIERYERERIPPVSFEIIAGRGSQGETRLGGGAVITFPITRRYQGEIARAEAGKSQAQRQLDVYRGVVQVRLRAARDAITSTKKALEELDQTGIPALERAVSASVEGFKAGKIDLTRALLARRDLAIARQRRLDLIEATWRAYADLVTFSGELP